MSSNEVRYNLFGGRRSAEALRSTGYKTTGHALGELVDNSLQANATKVKIIVEVKQVKREKRTRETIQRIATLDNGEGMYADELRNALLFGEGSHFDEKGGMGKFGVGLPQASLSQGTKITVWSWKNGSGSALRCGYDIEDEEWRAHGSQVPEPISDEVPSPWKKYVDDSIKTGTLVVWSRIDRLSQTSATGLFRDSEFLIGRMYRNWINDNKATIEFFVLDADTGDYIRSEKYRAVDPLYLMSGTSVSDKNPIVDPMFEELEPITKKFVYNGVERSVTIRASIAKKEIREKISKTEHYGTSDAGKHAAKNIGLSVVREGRELILDPRWTATTSNRKDPRNRWWGVEIDFGRDMDEIFGVTNDKQNAYDLCDLYEDSFLNYAEDGEKPSETEERLLEESPKLAINLSVAESIRKMIKNAWSKIPEEKKEPKAKKSENGEQTPEEKATAVINGGNEKDPVGKSDEKEDNMGEEEKKTELFSALKYMGIPEDEQNRIVKGYITDHLKFSFVKMDMPGSDEFFNIRIDGGLLLIILNTSHPQYSDLFSLLEYDNDFSELSPDELKALLVNGSNALKFLLISYARMEDVALRDDRKSVTKSRKAWGKMCKTLQGIDDDADD